MTKEYVNKAFLLCSNRW